MFLSCVLCDLLFPHSIFIEFLVVRPYIFGYKKRGAASYFSSVPFLFSFIIKLKREK